MKVRDLPAFWDKTAHGDVTDEVCTIRLSVDDAARLHALAEMYPKRRLEDIASDLLASALDELETSLPYVRGDEVISRDELGDPLYEDIGPTPTYLSLKRKHMRDYHNR